VAFGSNPKRFICSQSPLNTTVEAFWQMIIQEEIEMVVHLSAINELEKDLRKSAIYFPLKPNEFQSLVYGDYRVTNLKKVPVPDEPQIVCYFLQVRSGTVKHTVKVFHVSFWPERGIPEISLSSINLLGIVRASKKPILFHCSTGCGRSGTLVYIEMLLEKMVAGQTAESVIDVLKELRSQRYGAVQSELQFLFALRTILHYFMKRNTIEMSQLFLEFIDDSDSLIKKFMNEDKEKREKRAAEGVKESDMPSELDNEFVTVDTFGHDKQQVSDDKEIQLPSKN